MTMWLYQLSQNEQYEHPPTQYRLDVWEDMPWNWFVGNIRDGENPPPVAGEIVVFYYSGDGIEGGFYGWAVILRWQNDGDRGGRRLHFRPVAPSNILKMCPWNDGEAGRLANDIRGSNPRNTMFRVPEQFEQQLRQGMASWPSRSHGIGTHQGSQARGTS